MDIHAFDHTARVSRTIEQSGEYDERGSLDKGWLKGVRTGMERRGWASISRTV